MGGVHTVGTQVFSQGWLTGYVARSCGATEVKAGARSQELRNWGALTSTWKSHEARKFACSGVLPPLPPVHRVPVPSGFPSSMQNSGNTKIGKRSSKLAYTVE